MVGDEEEREDVEEEAKVIGQVGQERQKKTMCVRRGQLETITQDFENAGIKWRKEGILMT